MAVTVVRQTGSASGNSNSLTAQLSSTGGMLVVNSSTAGNRIVLVCVTNSASTTQGNWTCTDTKGNTWTIIAFKGATNGICIVVFTTTQNGGTLVAGTDTITVANATDKFEIFVCHYEELAGVLSVSPTDKTATNTGTSSSGNLPTGTTAATTQKDEIAFAVMSGDNNATLTKDAGYSNFTGVQINNQNTKTGDWVASYPTFKILTATGTQVATYTISGGTDNWTGLIVTLKAALVPVSGVAVTASSDVTGSLTQFSAVTASATATSDVVAALLPLSVAPVAATSYVTAAVANLAQIMGSASATSSVTASVAELVPIVAVVSSTSDITAVVTFPNDVTRLLPFDEGANTTRMWDVPLSTNTGFDDTGPGALTYDEDAADAQTYDAPSPSVGAFDPRGN